MKRGRERALDAEARPPSHDAKGLRIALAVSRFNHEITGRLLAGARQCLETHGADARDTSVVHVPGSWELQLAAGKLAASGRYDAVVALGALIRGETPHFEVLAQQVARGLAQVGLQTSVPVIFGVLTTNTWEQAMERAGERDSNKGWEAALAAVEMVHVCRALERRE